MNIQTLFDSLRRTSPGSRPIIRLMPALLIGFAVCVGGFSNCQSSAQEIQWFPDVASAAKAATEQNKLILMHFTAKWCKPCRSLETFVYKSPDVQRAFKQNVIAVKIDVDANTDLVEEYGVASVPYDIAVTPAGRVVSKRKSPKDAIAYEKMVNDFHTIIAQYVSGKSPALNQNMAELQAALDNQSRKFEGRPTSFTPDAPTYQAPKPSDHSAELKRRSQLISNPYVQPAQPAVPQRVVNAFSPVQEPYANSAKSPPVGFTPSGDFVPKGNFAPTGNFSPSGNISPAATPSIAKPQGQPQNSFVPQNAAGQLSKDDKGKGDKVQLNPYVAQSQSKAAPQQQQKVQVNPYVTNAKPAPLHDIAIQTQERSDAAAVARQKISPQNDSFKAEPKVVMNDKFFGKPKENQVPDGASSFQAKINLPESNDFVPPESPDFLGDVNAKIVLEEDTNKADDDQLQRPRTKAITASTSKIIPPTAGPSRPIATGLDMASNKTTKPNYALHGKCPVTLLAESKWIDGDPKWGCVHRNRIYIFTTEQKLKIFQSDPDGHSPILAGYDPVVFQETGRLVDGLEKHGVFMGKPPHQRIVLFANAQTRARFKAEPKRYLEAVRQAMEKTGASSKLLR